MRNLLLLGAFAWAALSAPASQQVMDGSLQGTIERILKTGQLWGYDGKALARGGDAGAVVLTRLYADRALSDDDIGKTLGILQNCFSNPAWVEKPADREPRTTLLLLRYLEFQTHSPDMRKMIGELRKVVLDRYAAYAKSDHAAPTVGP